MSEAFKYKYGISKLLETRTVGFPCVQTVHVEKKLKGFERTPKI